MTGFYYGLGISAAVVVPLYSVLLAWLLRKGKKTTDKHYGCFVWIIMLTFPIVFLIVWGLMPIYYLDPYSGRVVDADTGEPIAGAAVLVIFRSAAPGVAGTLSGVVDGRETQTDQNGEFKLEEELLFFSGKAGSPYGIVTAWKPGYKQHKVQWPNWENAFWESGKKRFGPPPYHVYKLKKLNTRAERLKNLRSLRSGYLQIPDEKIEYYLELFNKELIALGFKPSPKYIEMQQRKKKGP